jgi:hypothetical protein
MIKREATHTRRCGVRVQQWRLRRDEVAPFEESGEVLGQRPQADDRVSRGCRDLECHRFSGMVKHEFDFDSAVPPVVQADPNVQRQAVQGRGSQVLQQRARLDPVVQRREPPLRGGIAYGSVEKVEP